MEKKCGCWAVLKRGVRGSCKSSASKDSANTIPRTSLVYDAGISFIYIDRHTLSLTNIQICVLLYFWYSILVLSATFKSARLI